MISKRALIHPNSLLVQLLAIISKFKVLILSFNLRNELTSALYLFSLPKNCFNQNENNLENENEIH